MKDLKLLLSMHLIKILFELLLVFENITKKKFLLYSIPSLKLITFELKVYFFIIVVKVSKLFAIRLINYLSLYYFPFVKSSVIK